ncbi:MAG: PA14 domain-containing protein [Ardenticatenaceae bacterium]
MLRKGVFVALLVLMSNLLIQSNSGMAYAQGGSVTDLPEGEFNARVYVDNGNWADIEELVYDQAFEIIRLAEEYVVVTLDADLYRQLEGEGWRLEVEQQDSDYQLFLPLMTTSGNGDSRSAPSLQEGEAESRQVSPQRILATDVTGTPLGLDQVVISEFMADNDTLRQVNLSVGATASQSSTDSGAVASRAIDLNKNGDWRINSLASTNWEANPWWEVDLGSVQQIDQIVLWNRTDCCSERLSDFSIFVSHVPFTSTSYSATQSQSGVTEYYFERAVDLSQTFDINRRGRYMRVQLAGSNYLSLAEVQIYQEINHSVIQDEDGDESDWVELYNSGATAVNLEGWYLTDEEDDLTKWRLPAVTLNGGEYLVVFASSKNRDTAGSELHTNFKLKLDGEYLALVQPNETTIAFEYAPTYPAQFEGVSYGLGAGANALPGYYMETVTPGAANSAGATIYQDAPPEFSVERGFYDSPFTVALSSPMAGASIRYTLDGTTPSDSEGTLYSGPITINAHTILRAVAYGNGAYPSPVQTHSYLFLDDVIAQPTMSTEITEDATYGPLMREALSDIPSISLVTSEEIGHTEQPISVELLNPDGSPGFHIDGGVKWFGGTSLDWMPKKSMRLYFRSRYGESKLEYPFFSDFENGIGAADEFDQIALRTGSYDSAFYRGSGYFNELRGTYLRNRWIDDTQLEMGQPTAHGRFVHVYINGVYWGQHHLRERFNADFMASYVGGDDDDYETINRGEVPIDGDGSVWESVEAHSNSYEEVTPYLDVENFVDYMLANFYGGDFQDWWPTHNWAGAGPKEPGSSGYKFFSKDADLILLDANADVTDRSGPSRVFRNLWNEKHPDFQVLLADRIYQHYFAESDGALIPSRAEARFMARVDEVSKSIIAESARWGDWHNHNWDRDDEWMTEVNRLRDDFFPQRTAIVLQQLRDRDMYRFDVPTFSQEGGPVTSGFTLSISNPNHSGTIYYTTDGSDPYGGNGSVSATAINGDDYATVTITQNTIIKARIKSGGSTWSALHEGAFVLSQDWSTLKITEIHYNPPNEGAIDGDDLEFVEFKHTGNVALDLSGAAITSGFEYTFPAGTIIEPGQFVILARNLSAFNSKYADSIGQHSALTPFVDEFADGKLSNGGETITLSDPNDNVILSVTYDDDQASGWPMEADGEGYSLASVERDPTGDPNQPAYWQASRQIDGSPADDDLPPSDWGFNAEYFNNQDLTGTPLTRIDPQLNFNWGSGSPDPTISEDNFSVRWTGWVQPEYSEQYTFRTLTNNGVRLWINGQQVIERWNSGAPWPVEQRVTVPLLAGQFVSIKMEMFEASGNANAQLYWSSASQAEQSIPQERLRSQLSVDAPTISQPGDQNSDEGETVSLTINANDPNGDTLTFSAQGLPPGLSINSDTGEISGVPNSPDTYYVSVSVNDGETGVSTLFTWHIQSLTALGDGLNAEYFDNDDLTGTSISRIDPTVNFDWHRDTPDPALGEDEFSVRWSGWIKPRYSETYTFHTITNNGVRLWINDQLIIDQWHSGPPWPLDEQGSITLEGEQFVQITMEMFEAKGSAEAYLYWSSASQPEQIIPQIRLYSSLPSDAPSITNPGDQSHNQGDTVSLAIEATDPEGDELTFSATGLPVPLSINENTGHISGTATIDGTYHVQIESSDGTNRVSTTFTWVIHATQATDLPGTGLNAEYFKNQELTGASVTQIDPTVDFSWDADGPMPGIGPDDFSVRWTGWLKPKFTESYTLRTITNNGVRLWINDELLINNWQSGAPWPMDNQTTISLEAGQYYQIKMEMYDATGFAAAHLYWSSAHQPQQIIPQQHLYAAQP